MCVPSIPAPRWRLVVDLMAPLLLLAIALAVSSRLDLDHVVSDHFYDPVTRSFPWRHAVLGERVMHRSVRDATVVCGALGLVASFAGRRWLGPSNHRVVVVLTLSLLAGTSTVAMLKRVINRNCPWHLQRYGGSLPDEQADAPLISLTGHDLAFPAGHAAGGFSLLALYFAGRRRSRRAGAWGLMIGLGVGSVTGFGQVMRGAHFLSHNFWTAVVCWYLAWLVDQLVPSAEGGDVPR